MNTHENSVHLVNENFSSFPAGDFPYEPLLGAMGEYHYRPNLWYGGQWYDPTPVMGTGGIKMWMITGDRGRKYLEYSTSVKKTTDEALMLVTGDRDWTDYDASVSLRLFLRSGYAALLFRYQDSRSFYALALHNGKLILKVKKHEYEKILAEKDFDYTSDSQYKLQAVCSGSSISCLVDNIPVFTVEDTTFLHGLTAIAAAAPARFTDIDVFMPNAAYDDMIRNRRAYEKEVLTEKAKYPVPQLWKVIDLKNFGAGRNIRFGHLKGGSEWFIVIAQNQQRVHRDAFARVSCLTAIDLNGHILWQIGEPNPDHAFITCDLPLQIYDIDGDGRDEVITAIDFELLILDGATGKIKKSIKTPYRGLDDYPFDRLNPDGIRICNFSGGRRPTDILLKDRYKKLWAYNSSLELLWTYEAPVSTGHFGFTKDVNGDGRDELFVGYDLVDHTGKKIWSLPVHTDHTDEIVIGPIDPDSKKDHIAIVSGSEGFMIADLNGKILVKDLIGHAQRVSVGKFRPDLPGHQICVTTFWGNQGIIRLYDCKGALLWSTEQPINGNVLTPINWSGRAEDLILLNGNVANGGMIDGYGRRVVEFPADGHPETCAEAINLTGDARDEIVLWDEKRMFIYTQGGTPPAVCADPDKYPYWNASNYRGEYSFHPETEGEKNVR